MSTPSTSTTIRARLLSLGGELAALPPEIEQVELKESAARRSLKDAELTEKDRLNELGALAHAEGKNEVTRKAALLEMQKKDAALHTLTGVVNMRADELERVTAEHNRLKRMFTAKQIQAGLLTEHSAWERLLTEARRLAAQGNEQGDGEPSRLAS